MSELTHYKKLVNPDYLGAYSLDPGKDMVLTIESVNKETITVHKGKEEDLTVARFKENQKPMILNVTNCKTIADVYGTPYIENWSGKKIQIYATEVKFGSDMVEALRIRPTEPKSTLPQMNANHKLWEKLKGKVKAGEIDLSGVRKHYTITNKNWELLCG